MHRCAQIWNFSSSFQLVPHEFNFFSLASLHCERQRESTVSHRSHTTRSSRFGRERLCQYLSNCEFTPPLPNNSHQVRVKAGLGRGGCAVSQIPTLLHFLDGDDMTLHAIRLHSLRNEWRSKENTTKLVLDQTFFCYQRHKTSRRRKL